MAERPSDARSEPCDEGAAVITLHHHDRKAAGDAIIKLSRAHNAVMRRIHKDLAGPGLTFTQFAVMEVLYSKGPMCQRDVGRKILSQSSGNVTAVIDQLERRGLVERDKRSDDRRMNEVRLTSGGREVIGEFLPHHLDVIAQEFSVLSPQELQTLASLLKRLGLGRGQPTEANPEECEG